LTLNKADFIRAGKHGAHYLAYRKAIQDAVSRQLEAWGVGRDRQDDSRRRVARPVERDLERILMDLAGDFPLLTSLVEQRAGGQKSLAVGVADDAGRRQALAEGPEDRDTQAPADGGDASSPADRAGDSTEHPPPPATGVLETAKRTRRRPTKYRLRIQFEQRPKDPELSRLEQSTVWVNEAHPAYARAEQSRSTGYHIALSTALALSRLAVDPAEEHEFVVAFLAHWGKAVQKRPTRRKNRRKKS
jgi:hypothetical protein